jgi:hypothetical protein
MSFLDLPLHSHQKFVQFSNSVYQLEICGQIFRSFSGVITSYTELYNIYFLLSIQHMLCARTRAHPSLAYTFASETYAFAGEFHRNLHRTIRVNHKYKIYMIMRNIYKFGLCF